MPSAGVDYKETVHPGLCVALQCAFLSFYVHIWVGVNDSLHHETVTVTDDLTNGGAGYCD